MPKKFTDEEYARMLPKKQVGTAVVFFNTRGELLIIKPDYKDGWLIPGGAADDDESPLHCAIRETREEVGLDVSDLQLVGLYYNHKNGVFSDSLKFIFFGGILTDDLIAQIKIQHEEIEEFKFIAPEMALPLLSKSLQKSIPKCLLAIKNKTVLYME
jgi:8-oxo-dGTP pyrophosphatase MutT (NUDIX family)